MSLYCAVQHALEGDHRMGDNCVCFRAYSITIKYYAKDDLSFNHRRYSLRGSMSCGIVPCHAANRSRIHERTISLRFLGILILRLEVSVHNVYITNQFQNHFCSRGAGVKPFVKVTKNSWTFIQFIQIMP